MLSVGRSGGRGWYTKQTYKGGAYIIDRQSCSKDFEGMQVKAPAAVQANIERKIHCKLESDLSGNGREQVFGGPADVLRLPRAKSA